MGRQNHHEQIERFLNGESVDDEQSIIKLVPDMIIEKTVCRNIALSEQRQEKFHREITRDIAETYLIRITDHLNQAKKKKGKAPVEESYKQLLLVGKFLIYCLAKLCQEELGKNTDIPDQAKDTLRWINGEADKLGKFNRLFGSAMSFNLISMNEMNKIALIQKVEALLDNDPAPDDMDNPDTFVVVDTNIDAVQKRDFARGMWSSQQERVVNGRAKLSINGDDPSEITPLVRPSSSVDDCLEPIKHCFGFGKK